MNDGGDCRTAPATRGLLKMVMFTKNDFLVECMAKKVLISWCTEKKKNKPTAYRILQKCWTVIVTFRWDSVVTMFSVHVVRSSNLINVGELLTQFYYQANARVSFHVFVWHETNNIYSNKAVWKKQAMPNMQYYCINYDVLYTCENIFVSKSLVINKNKKLCHH